MSSWSKLRRFFALAAILGLFNAPPCFSADSLSFGFALDGNPVTRQVLNSVRTETGLRPRIIVFFLQWPASPKNMNFPESSLKAISQSGAIPCLTWEPMYHVEGEEVMVPAEKILSGDYDLYLNGFADKMKSWGKPVLVRFAHEMNLNRYHWGTTLEEYGEQSPELYQRMFRHVVSIFRNQGADNVHWVFCPNAESVPNVFMDPAAHWNQIGSYYPGDDVVDVLGMDGYNWGTTQTMEKHGWESHWRSFDEVFRAAYGELKDIAPDKPLFIFETACAREGGDKSQWVREAFSTLKGWEVDGIVWFQVNKEIDWRLNSGLDPSVVKLIKRATGS